MMDKMSNLATIILAALGSTGLFAFVQFIITRHDDKEKKKSVCECKFESLDKQFDKLERDLCRTQLLLMMKYFSDNVQEILILAEHYFVDLNCNWYMTSIFSDWLKKNKLSIPTWFKNR